MPFPTFSFKTCPTNYHLNFCTHELPSESERKAAVKKKMSLNRVIIKPPTDSNFMNEHIQKKILYEIPPTKLGMYRVEAPISIIKC